MNSFKSQQHRWAKGSIQTCMKLLPRILRVQPAAVGQGRGVLPPLGELQLPADVAAVDPDVPGDVGPLQHGLDGDAADRRAAVLRGHAVGRATSTWFRSVSCIRTGVSALKYLPFLMSIGIGLCVNNTRAVLEAIFDKQSEFARTPKYGIERRQRRVGRQEVPPVGRRPADHRARAGPVLHRRRSSTRWRTRSTATLPFLMLFQIGFLYTGPALDPPAVHGRERDAQGAGNREVAAG